jgi:hypothetical protein
VTTLVKSGQPLEEDIEFLRARMAELDTALKTRVDDITRAKTDLAAFRILYRKEVGLLHEELDELERQIAEAELGEISKAVAEAGGDPTAPIAGTTSEPETRYTSDAVRRLFRDVAKIVHPDLARDEITRDRRHALMIEANKAYALGDEERLRWILQAWENSPEAVQDSDPDAARTRILRRISQREEELGSCSRELSELHESPLWKLKRMVDEAAVRGKDLGADMVRRLKRDVMAARNRLDAMLWNP